MEFSYNKKHFPALRYVVLSFAFPFGESLLFFLISVWIRLPYFQVSKGGISPFTYIIVDEQA